MSPYTAGGGKVIDMNTSPILKLVGLGVIVLVLIILFFSAVTRVESVMSACSHSLGGSRVKCCPKACT